MDAGTRSAAGKLLAAIEGRAVSALAVTHAHADHQGGTHAICDRLGIPLWCGEGDRVAFETGDLSTMVARPASPFGSLSRAFAGPGHPVARTLAEGDEVGGFRVVETPGHTPGHLAFWRASDRILVLGDLAFHRSPATFRLGLREPFSAVTVSPQRNRLSLKRVAALGPALICFGHGPPLADAHAFRQFTSALP